MLPTAVSIAMPVAMAAAMAAVVRAATAIAMAGRTAAGAVVAPGAALVMAELAMIPLDLVMQLLESVADVAAAAQAEDGTDHHRKHGAFHKAHPKKRCFVADAWRPSANASCVGLPGYIVRHNRRSPANRQIGHGRYIRQKRSASHRGGGGLRLSS
jgi:hypothetical protein